MLNQILWIQIKQYSEASPRSSLGGHLGRNSVEVLFSVIMHKINANVLWGITKSYTDKADDTFWVFL